MSNFLRKLQKKTPEDIYDILKTVFQILLIAFLVVLIVYEFTPLYLGFYPLYLLFAVVTFGASVIFISQKLRYTKSMKMSSGNYMLCCIAGVVCTLGVWYTTMVFGIISYLISVSSGFLVTLFSILTLRKSLPKKVGT